MKNLRHVLVAIKNPAARAQPALRKAAQLAQGSGAKLTLFHALTAPMYADAFALEGQSLQQTQRHWRDRVLKQLEKLAAPLRAAGLNVAVASDWDFPAYEAVVRSAARLDADLIVAERHADKHRLPWLLRFNDWELLRRCPVPVLLVKSARAWKRPAVLAAIDPTHSFAKPAKLDAGILAAAAAVSEALGGKTHVGYAWPGAPMPTPRSTLLTPALFEAHEKREKRAAQEAFNAAVGESGIKVAKKHFVAGHPADAIPKLARQVRAGVVVMGAISRSGLKRLLVGNIAEQVLDALSCDVLVLKPADFKPRVAKQGRGVQLVPTPPYI
jgi:universal stress protein E